MLDIVERNLNNVDGVYFDYGGVIVQSPRRENWAVLDYCEHFGIARDFALREIARMRRAYDGGEISLTECYRRIAESAHADVEAGFSDKAAKLDAESWTNLIESTFTLMCELKTLGKKVGVLSNMSQDFFRDQYCRVASHIREICDSEVISGFVGYTKPDPAIYALAAQKIGCLPSHLLFLDDMQSNVDAARACGWHAERFSLNTNSALN